MLRFRPNRKIEPEITWFALKAPTVKKDTFPHHSLILKLESFRITGLIIHIAKSHYWKEKKMLAWKKTKVSNFSVSLVYLKVSQLYIPPLQLQRCLAEVWLFMQPIQPCNFLGLSPKWDTLKSGQARHFKILPTQYGCGRKANAFVLLMIKSIKG